MCGFHIETKVSGRGVCAMPQLVALWYAFFLFFVFFLFLRFFFSFIHCKTPSLLL